MASLYREDDKRPHVILDLDNTLICALNPSEIKNKKESRYSHLDFFNMDNYYIVFSRPYLQKFLDFLFKHFKVSVWTAATKSYAVSVIDHCILNKPERKLEYIFFDVHCKLAKKMVKGKSPKILKLLWDDFKLDFDKDNTIIIDDLIDVYKAQPELCYNIPAFTLDNSNNGSSDKELKKLMKKMDKALKTATDDSSVVKRIKEQK